MRFKIVVLLTIAIISMLYGCQNELNFEAIETDYVQEQSPVEVTEQPISQIDEIQQRVAQLTKENRLGYIAYPSAIQMCDFDLAIGFWPEDVIISEDYMNKLLEQAVGEFASQTPEQVTSNVEKGLPLSWASSGDEIVQTLLYTTDSPKNEDEVHLLAVGIGTGVNAVFANGLIWYEDKKWRWQPYPQAPSEIAEQRYNVLKDGLCRGTVTELYQSGQYVAAVVTMGLGSTMHGEEVQLLKHENGKWDLIWAPVYDNNQQLYLAEIEFENGIESYTVSREAKYKDPDSRYEERWELRGEQYVLVSTTKQE